MTKFQSAMVIYSLLMVSFNIVTMLWKMSKDTMAESSKPDVLLVGMDIGFIISNLLTFGAIMFLYFIGM